MVSREIQIGDLALNGFEPVSFGKIHVPSPEENREASERLIAINSKSINPKTGLVYSYAQLAEIFHYHKATIRKKLTSRGIYLQPFPEVRKGELPLNERAFFKGLVFGNYPIRHMRWSAKNFVAIWTESKNPRHTELLEKTLGTWGETRLNSKSHKVYLASPTFDFMLDTPVDSKFLKARSRFSPFLLGLLTARLSDRGNRLSLRDEALLRIVHRHFEDHFGFSIGHLRVEKRTGLSKNGHLNEQTIPVIIIKKPGVIFSALIQDKSVATLPFLPSLAKLPVATNSA